MKRSSRPWRSRSQPDEAYIPLLPIKEESSSSRPSTPSRRNSTNSLNSATYSHSHTRPPLPARARTTPAPAPRPSTKPQKSMTSTVLKRSTILCLPRTPGFWFNAPMMPTVLYHPAAMVQKQRLHESSHALPPYAEYRASTDKRFQV